MSRLMKWTGASVLAFVLAVIGQVHAADTARQALERFQQQVSSLQAEFSQQLLDEDGEVVQTSSGTLYFQRPNLFHWAYREPYPQQIIGDGRRFWIYDSELEQVTVKDMEEALSGSPMLVLSGERPLGEVFQMHELGEREGARWLELTPVASDTDFQRIRVAIDDELRAMELEDDFGQVTRIDFDAVQRNPDLDPQRFRFTVPPDADVVGSAG